MINWKLLDDVTDRLAAERRNLDRIAADVRRDEATLVSIAQMVAERKSRPAWLRWLMGW